MAPLQVLLWHILVPALVTSHLVAGASNSSMPGPDCHMCGNIEIPYPFGIGEGCGRPGFNPYVITCDDSFSPPRPYLVDVEIASISPETGEIRVFSLPSYLCYNLNSPRIFTTYDFQWTLNDPFVISERRNEFTAIGCSTVAMLKSTSYYTGCVSYCVSIEDAAADGDKCTGLGCCQIPISGNLSTTEVRWNYKNGTDYYYPWEYSQCSFAFVAEKGWYNFSRQDLILDGNNSFFSRSS
uniref:Wall-associated receptor kinase galacturonan-binding domain-containing protein n=1 Tax=Setaria viridis TaxID=4556 RepID=A0A4U6VYM8_SETVI|nr:wall-associated receptor kinase 1-like isoform X1 [Setaria viridis]XP_034581420.1 wall-associated receptor kinase 1-like isoform X1 [Setaria viridis]TKW30147.1 hypothetical protein SEVIR_2G015951v2 [Setaria viridis]